MDHSISIRKLNAVVRIGLDTVTFIVSNPDWGMAPQLASVFQSVSETIREKVQLEPKTQEATMAFHVTPGATGFRATTARMVNQDLVGDALFYGISLHRADGSLIIDKSLRYEGAAFVRLQRRFPGDATFSEVSSRLYEDRFRRCDYSA